MQDALRPLEGRWKLMIMAQLLAGPAMRFSDLEGALPQISQKMLIQRLRDLEEDGIVSRTLYPQVPPKVEYCLTEVGKGLEIASWSATKIEYRERWLDLDILQQRRDILADVVVAGAFAEIIGCTIILFEGKVDDSF